MGSQYFLQRDQKNQAKLDQLLETLPPVCGTFFRGIENNTSSMTRLSYAYDLTAFFSYLKEHKEGWSAYSTEDIKMELIREISVEDIEAFLSDSRKRTNEYRNKCREQYQDMADTSRQVNHDKKDAQYGLKRKFLAVKSFFGYLCRTNRLAVNPTEPVYTPKPNEKEVIRLNSGEMRQLLDRVETGEGLIGREKAFHKRTKVRDSALIALMLGTGIRVSECVGLNLDDVDLKERGIHIRRKGGKESTVYFNQEVAERLSTYLEERMQTEGVDSGDKTALFLSLRKKRITVRSVEKLVVKYASFTEKHITPHKLRSSYGSYIYEQTNDIYLVSKLLGHRSVNTTRLYTDVDEERRKSVKDIEGPR